MENILKFVLSDGSICNAKESEVFMLNTLKTEEREIKFIVDTIEITRNVIEFYLKIKYNPRFDNFIDETIENIFYSYQSPSNQIMNLYWKIKNINSRKHYYIDDENILHIYIGKKEERQFMELINEKFDIKQIDKI